MLLLLEINHFEGREGKEGREGLKQMKLGNSVQLDRTHLWPIVRRI